MRFDPDTHTVHAAGRTWHADPTRTSITDLTTGHIVHRDRRCILRFETGWAASIVWGSGTYSTNHDAWHRTDTFTEEPATVEVGVLDHTGELRQRLHDEDGTEWHDIEAYLDDDALIALLDRLSALPTDHDYGIAPPTLDEVRANYEQTRQALADNRQRYALEHPIDEPHLRRIATCKTVRDHGNNIWSSTILAVDR